MRDIDGVLYCNDGDWVESLTALVEHADGRLEILDWAERMAVATRRADPVAPRASLGEEPPMVADTKLSQITALASGVESSESARSLLGDRVLIS
jgi:hypothetical protein